MTTPEIPTAAPLDAERARLRSAGYTDAEIGHILMQREIGASPQQPVPGAAPTSGVLSGALNSLVAVASHARGYIVGTKADFATLFGTASPAARVKAGGSLVLKAVIVAVLGYAALQEWNQHIINATEIARSEAVIKRQHAEAAVEAGRPLCGAKTQAELLMTPDESVTAENKKALDALCDESPEPAADRVQKLLTALRAGQPPRCEPGQNYVAGACRPIAPQ